MRLKFFNQHFNPRGHRKTRTMLKKMVSSSTQSTHFMDPFISNGDRKKIVRGWYVNSTRQRFSNIKIKTQMGKPPFFPKKVLWSTRITTLTGFNRSVRIDSSQNSQGKREIHTH